MDTPQNEQKIFKIISNCFQTSKNVYEMRDSKDTKFQIKTVSVHTNWNLLLF
jgi:hypothetical protein